MRCYDCGAEFAFSDYHYVVCTERGYVRFCGCRRCEGHREGKERARDADEAAAQELRMVGMSDDAAWRLAVFVDAGRFMEGVRR